MSGKLAVKHKSSLALRDNKLLQEPGRSKVYGAISKPFQLIFFPIITVCIFVTYWLVLCPLLFDALSNRNMAARKSWPIWPLLYWLFAFFIWIVIMLMLVAIWRRVKSKYSKIAKSRSYGLNDPPASDCIKNMEQTYPADIKLRKIKEDGDIDLKFDTKKEKSIDKELNNPGDITERWCDSNNQTKKRKDLSPLIIHRHISGDGIENSGIVNVGEKITAQLGNEDPIKPEDKATADFNRDSMKDYLKLVTVTPSEDEEGSIKSPKGPLSPRELFFIDLIREAEKAEKYKENNNPKSTAGTHFFPKHFSPTVDVENEKDMRTNEKNVIDDTSSQLKNESSYFIANIESLSNEKTEVFLEINPEPECLIQWPADLNNEKPVLIMRHNTAAQEEGSSKENVVIFEV